jgi:chitosanase
MDIDCDGANNSAGRCSNDPSGQGETAFKDTVKSYGIADLNANVHPYVVFGNEGASPSFNPQSKGMEPLSVMAIVCNNQLVCVFRNSVFGSLACSFFALPKRQLLTATVYSSSTEFGVIQMASLLLERLRWHWVSSAFPMATFRVTMATTPGKNGANWKAKNAAAFESSIKSLGDKLVASL